MTWTVSPYNYGYHRTRYIWEATVDPNSPEIICEVRMAFDEAGNRDHAEQLRRAMLLAAAPELLEALKDMLAGWRYIRERHGDLYGVGWDRCEEAARAALARAGEP